MRRTFGNIAFDEFLSPPFPQKKGEDQILYPSLHKKNGVMAISFLYFDDLLNIW
jgi:hypothetical protein